MFMIKIIFGFPILLPHNILFFLKKTYVWDDYLPSLCVSVSDCLCVCGGVGGWWVVGGGIQLMGLSGRVWRKMWISTIPPAADLLKVSLENS